MPDDAAATAPRLLDYARRPSRRKVFRRLVATVLLISCVCAACRLAPPAWRHTQLLYAQARCLRYAAPPDDVVFDSESAPGVLAAYDWNDRIQTTTSVPGTTATPNPFRPEPTELAALRSQLPATPPGVAVLPAFMGKRVSPAGHRRLVIVSPGCVHLLGTCVTLDPTPLLATAKAPPPRFGTVAARVFIDLIDKTPVVIYAGQRDPVDASHFTIRFVRGAAEAIVDGYLEDDGSVRLCERDGRATRPRNPLPPPVFSW